MKTLQRNTRSETCSENIFDGRPRKCINESRNLTSGAGRPKESPARSQRLGARHFDRDHTKRPVSRTKQKIGRAGCFPAFLPKETAKRLENSPLGGGGGARRAQGARRARNPSPLATQARSQPKPASRLRHARSPSPLANRDRSQPKPARSPPHHARPRSVA